MPAHRAAPSAAGDRPPSVPGLVLDRLLGRGGSGEVWAGRPRGGGAPVAVKLLPAGDAERQEREAALLDELDHPHVVRLHRVLRCPDGRVALVLDLLDGGSLARLLARRGRLRPGEVVTALSPVAAALAHAHERGVVHGDLAPGNVLFTGEGRPVLTDLGMAGVLGGTAGAGVTPGYVDPVVARGGAPGPASDVFGVGALAFAALAGVPPWNAADPEQALAVARAGLLPDLAELAPGAPEDLVAVVLRALDPDPHRRGTAAELALDLRHACRPEPVRLPTAGVPDADLARTGAGPRTELTLRPAAARDPRPTPALPRGERAGRVVDGVRRAGRVGAAVLGTLVLVGLAGWLGARWGSRSEPPAAAPVPAATEGTPPTTAPDPTVPAAPVSSAPVPTAPVPIPVPAPSTAPAPTASPTASPTVSPAAAPPTPEDAAGWAAVVGDLYRGRAEAFTTGRADLLDAVFVGDSDRLAADRAALADLAARGAVLRGFAPVVQEVTAWTPEPDGAVELRVVDGWGPYEVVSGAAAAQQPGRPPAPARLVLVPTSGGWRLADAERVS